MCGEVCERPRKLRATGHIEYIVSRKGFTNEALRKVRIVSRWTCPLPYLSGTGLNQVSSFFQVSHMNLFFFFFSKGINYFEVWLNGKLMPVFTLMLSHILILGKSGSPEQDFWSAERSVGLGSIWAERVWETAEKLVLRLYWKRQRGKLRV